MPKEIKTVRTRSVHSVIDELKIAKKELKKLVFVHFYDEIFPNTPGWVDEFVVEYKKHINLPFTIWSHPKMVDEKLLLKLKKIGLTEIIMGIQSGSVRVRKDVFSRNETQADVLKAVSAIQKAKLHGAFDFMLRHPFETVEDIKETFKLVSQFKLPFELQLHGLNFLPGTDIVEKAIDGGYITKEKMDEIMYAPMQEQFSAYWHREGEKESDLWYKLIYCLQFKGLNKKAMKFANDPFAFEDEINACYIKGEKKAKQAYMIKKIKIVIKSKI